MLRNALLNLGGLVLPVLVALAAVPSVAHGYGEARFALLMLVVNLLVAFAFFDMGIGLGTTKHVATALGTGRGRDVPVLVWSSLVAVGAVGTALGAALYLATPALVHLYGSVSPDLERDAIGMFSTVALSIPFVTGANVLRGVLEASERFDVMNAVKVPATVLLFLIPMLGALGSWTLLAVALALAASRVLVLAAYFAAACAIHPDILHAPRVRKAELVSLLRFGGWVSVSNVINPAVTQGERFLIPAALSLPALAYYTAPYEILARTSVVPYSLAMTLFPRLSAQPEGDRAGVHGRYLHPPLRALLFLFTPLCVALILFAPEILRAWLGGAYAAHSAAPLRILTLGFYANAFAYIAWSAVQGFGRPDLKAKLDLVEAALFFPATWFLVRAFGLAGAAAAKSAVFALDFAALFVFTRRLTRVSWREFLPPRLGRVFLASLAAIACAACVDGSLALRAAAGSALAGGFLVVYLRTFAREDLPLLRSAFARADAPAPGEGLG